MQQKPTGPRLWSHCTHRLAHGGSSSEFVIWSEETSFQTNSAKLTKLDSLSVQRALERLKSKQQFQISFCLTSWRLKLSMQLIDLKGSLDSFNGLSRLMFLRKFACICQMTQIKWRWEDWKDGSRKTSWQLFFRISTRTVYLTNDEWNQS